MNNSQQMGNGVVGLWGAVLLVVCSVAMQRIAQAQENVVTPTASVEGRPAATVPTGPNVTLLSPDGGGVVLYEVQRVKRTPPLEPALGLQDKWDPLYSAQDGTGKRTGYLNWDNNYLYLAAEVPAPTIVRFELDMKNDGWLRGADNLVVQIDPDGNTVNGITGVKAFRFDTVQNKDRPVWAMAPFPLEEMKVRSGRTAQGNYGVIVALPRRPDAGLNCRAGQTFGVRFDAGNLPNPEDETELALRPMLRVTLVDEIIAMTTGGLSVRVLLDSREISPGENIRATLEIKNNSKEILRTGRMFLLGSQASSPYIDSASFALSDVPPGKSIKRELRSSVAPTTPLGAVVVAGGFEVEGGKTITALTSFDRVDPYEVLFETEQRAVVGGGETTKGDLREAKLVIKSKAKAKDTAQATLTLPEGWTLEGGKTTEERSLKFKGDVQGIFWKILVPTSAPPGEYPVSVVVEVAGKTYRRTDTIAIIP
jgi:hypothetical protein